MSVKKYLWRGFCYAGAEAITSQMFDTQKACQDLFKKVVLLSIDPNKRIRFFFNWGNFVEARNDASFHAVFIQRCYTKEDWKKWGYYRV